MRRWRLIGSAAGRGDTDQPVADCLSLFGGERGFQFGFFGQHTPLVWNAIVRAVQGLSIGMVIGPVTAALMNTLPLERAGAGSAVTNTVRQTGSVLGIAVGGTIISIAYRRAIDVSLHDLPGPVQDRARISAEQARHTAAAIDPPVLADAADNAFIHAMHVGTVCTMLIALGAAAVTGPRWQVHQLCEL